MYARKLSAYLLVLLLSTAAFTYMSFGAQADKGSADIYGYYWTDSSSPEPTVAFNWIDITATGTDAGFVDADNEHIGPVPIGFDFEFYGNTYSMLNISTNGYVQFGASSSRSYNDMIPSSDWYSPNNIAAVFWANLVVNDTSHNNGAVYYETIGVSPHSQFVIEYHEISWDYYPSDLMTFEIILNETGEIWFQYLSMNGQTGEGATVGIENIAGDVGTQYLFNQELIYDGLAIMFERGPIGFGPDMSANADWGGVGEYEVGLVNLQAFTDSFDITVDYTDLGWSVELLDDTYTPLADSNLNGIPDTGNLAPSELFTLVVRIAVPDPPTTQNETTVLLASSYLDPSVNDTVTLTTKADQAVFAPPFNDHAVDSDLDGDYDQFIIDVVVDALVGGFLYLYAELRDSSAEYISADDSYANVPAGLSTITMLFPGEDVYESMRDGPYTANITLADAEWNVIAMTDYTTSAYLYTDFDEPAAMFRPPFSDYAMDNDADGSYDILVLNVTVEVFEAGFYTVEAGVYSASPWRSIGYAEASDMLGVGIHQMQFLLLGAWVNESGIDGPCGVYMDLLKNNQTWVVRDYYYETSSYIWSDFEGTPVAFLPPYDDRAEDTDLDGYYDHLIITIPIECYKTGVYDLDVTITLSLQPFDIVHESLSLDAGTTTMYNITYDAAKMQCESINGNLDLEMALSDVYTHLMYGSDEYATDYYYYWEFAPSAVQFGYPHSDYALDDDDDTTYDYLVIVVAVDCIEAGEYTLTVHLYDFFDTYLTTVSKTEYMTADTESLEVAFEGWIIRLNGMSAHFFVELLLEDEEGQPLDRDTHTTSYYYAYSFCPPPGAFAPPHGDIGVDDDDDTLYEHLVVEVSVEVDEARDYRVTGILHDEYDNAIDAASNETYLSEGAHVVELWFGGWSIAVAAGDPWYVALELLDDADNLMDTDSHDLAGTYTRSNFDSSTPTIRSGWAYDSPSVDGAVAADEWFGAAEADVVAADGMNTLAATIHILNNHTHLFVLVDVAGDTSESTGDMISIAFDTGNDEMQSDGHEDWFMLETTEGGVDATHMVYDDLLSDWVTHCSPFDGSEPDHGGLAGAVGFGMGVSSADDAHRIYELCVPLALLMVSPGEAIGFAGLPAASDSDGSEYSTWPVFFWEMPPMTMYGDLMLSEELPLTTITLEGDEGENGWFVGDVIVTLNATGGTGGVADTSYRLDGSGWQTYSAPFTISTDGVHTVQYYSNDTAGNDEPVRTTAVMIDTEIPETTANVNGTMGLDGWLVSSARITFVTTDNASGLAFIMYRLNGDDWRDLEGDALRLTGSGGIFVLDYYAVDIAGHHGFTKSLEFKFDIDDPVTTAAVEDSTVTLTVWDEASGSAGTMYRIDGGDWTAYEGAFEVKGKGTHTVEYYSTDVAGNVEEVKTIAVEGTSSTTMFGLDWWMVLLIGVIIVLIAIGAVYGMRRGAKGPGGPEPMPPQPHMMMMEEPPPAWPGPPQTPPVEEELPPPPERQD